MDVIPPKSLADWFDAPLGEYVLEREREWLDASVPDIFGFHAVQLGMPQFDLLRESRITHRVIVDPKQGEVRAQFHALPFDAQSIDLIVLPHVLEFDENPHEILREVDRVMRPDGRILLIGFNPWSLFGARRVLAQSTRIDHPWCGQFVSLVRLKDWLQLLSFEPANGKLACYIPPVESPKWQSRWAFMESQGDRWWGVAGGVYMLEAIKRVEGMRLIAPAWRRDATKERRYAAATNRGVGGAGINSAPRAHRHLNLIK
jgi:SAM-dependent methyltransferase